MPDEKGKDLRMFKMRKFPILLGFAASIFFSVMGGGSSIILLSLGEFTFTVSLLLTLIAVFNEIITKIRTPKSERKENADNKKTLTEEAPSKPKRFLRIRAFLSKLFRASNTSSHDFDVDLKQELSGVMPAENEGEAEQTEQTIVLEAAENAAASDGLIEIHKHGASGRARKDASRLRRSKYETIAAVLYILSFACMAYWRITRMTTILPLSYSETFSYSMIQAILLLLFPCVAVIYLKMRKDDGTRAGDKASHDMLMLVSYVSLVYAATIAASSVLNVNILVALQWLFYAVTVYLFAAVTFNIATSILLNDIVGNFKYTLIPRISKAGGDGVDFLDSDEVRLNFSLKSLYTIKYTLRIFPWLIIALGLTLFLSTTMFIVQPHQQAVVYRLGKINEASVVKGGYHFKLPWPFDIAYIYDVHRVNDMMIGYEASGSENFLWGRAHDGGEYRLLIGNGNEVTAVNMKIVYRISDLYSYVTTCSRPEDVLSAAAYETLVYRTINTTLDRFLTVDRSSLSASILNELAKFCEAERLGLSVVQVIIESIHPPIEVASTYQMVVSALIDKNTRVISAKTNAESKIINAERDSKVAIDNSKAQQFRKVSAAQNEMAVYYAAMEAHKISPESFELTKYLDTSEAVIRGSKVYVFSPAAEGDISKAIIGRLNTTNVNSLKTIDNIINPNPQGIN